MQNTVKIKRAKKHLQKALEELKSFDTTNLKIDELADEMRITVNQINYELSKLRL